MIIQKIINRPREHCVLEFEVYSCVWATNVGKYEWYLKSVYRNVRKELDGDFPEELFMSSKYFATEDEAVKDLEQVLALLGIE